MQQCSRKFNSPIISQYTISRMHCSQDSFTPTEDHQLQPSIDKLISIVRKCTKERNFGCGLCIVAYLQENNPEAHNLLGKHIVPMFVEAGSVHDGRNVFDRLGSRSERCWNSLVNGYLENEMVDQAFLLHRKMQQDSVYTSGYTFVALLKICTKLKDTVKGSEVHADILKSGLLKKDLFVGSALVDMYAKCSLLENAQDVFDNLPIRNVVSWNALIGGYAKHDCGKEALELLERMRVEDVSPNAVTFICCLKACGSMEAIDKGREIHGEIMRRSLLAKQAFLGNALVDMYAKCGSLSKAQEVFHGLLHQDVASWNALIAGFVKHEHGEKALNLFKRMQKDGVSPDVITFACSLKACGIIEDAEERQTLHAEVETNGLLNQHPILGNALVDMYGKCGLLEKAQEVFDKLPTHDLVSWNALASGYAKYELDQEALNCFEQMQIEGISPDSITFACSLKACGNKGLLDKGQRIHADMNQKGFVVDDAVVCNALVSMYASCGYLGKAWEVFEALPHRSTVSWNAVISGHVRQGCGEEALTCFRQMQEEGVSPSAITYACCLKASGSIGATDEGIELHAELARKGLLERDVVLGGSLVDMYSKCGLLENAQEVFDALMQRDLVSWNALIAGYANHECGELALLCFEEMQSEGVIPDAATFACLFKACGSIGNVNQGLEMHAESERKELFKEDVVAGSALVDMYAKCGLLAKAHEVFIKLPLRSVVSWSALIAGYAKHEEGEAALNCYKEMQLEGFSPDVITLACTLKACGSITATCKGQEMHAEIERKGLLASDIVIGNSLVDMYAKCGCRTIAYDLFDKLPIRDVVSWNALIAGNLKHGHGEVVLDSFEQMQAEGISPDEVSYVCSLKACGSLGTTRKGKEMHARIEKHELLERDLLVGNAVVDMYAKGGFIEEAENVFDKLPKKSIITWNALISGYAQLGLSGNVLDNFEKMLKEGYKPDPATFTSVLNVCCHTGLVDKAAMYFYAMSREYSITPTVDHLSCVVDLLGRAGQLERALAIMEQLPAHPDVVISSAVLGACRKWGNMVLGRQVFEHASRLYVEESSMLICMYNMYADADVQEKNEETNLYASVT